MSTITLNIHGRPYNLNCNDGEEAELQMLAQDLSERLAQLDSSFGNEAQSLSDLNVRLVINSLMMLADLRDTRHNARRRSSQDREEVEEVIADTLERIASKLETLAA